MKLFIQYACIFLILLESHGLAFEISGENVLINKEETEQIDHLYGLLFKFHERNFGLAPDLLKTEILKADSADKIDDLSSESIKWIEAKLIMQRDVELSKAFDAVLKWSNLNGADANSIIRETFWDFAHGKPFQLLSKISDYIINSIEMKPPDIRFSPSGHGEIGWYWKLLSPRRKSGILHVGIDLKKRTFVCYERDLGVYFPEGETMDRIYTEIVQDPEMAGIWVGKGFRKEK